MNDIKFDEKLSEAVRRFPCLYDKTKKEYKDKFINRNAWETIAKELELENGDRATKLFQNLKKRFSKRRNDFKKSQRSGTSTSAVTSAKVRFEEYNFMVWLVQFIKPRSTKSNLFTSAEYDENCDSPALSAELGNESEEDDEMQMQSQYFEEKDFTSNNDEVSPEASTQSRSQTPAPNHTQTPAPNHTFTQSKSQTPAPNHNKKSRKCFPTTSEVTGNSKWNRKGIDIDQAEMQFITSANRFINEKEPEIVKEVNDYIGLTIASELKLLSPREQIVAKHQIRNVMFNLQINKVSDQSSVLQETPNHNHNHAGQYNHLGSPAFRQMTPSIYQHETSLPSTMHQWNTSDQTFTKRKNYTASDSITSPILPTTYNG